MSSLFCKIHVNGIKILVLKNYSIMEACGLIGLNIPRFCFHKRLTVAGNCRMCLVEIDKSPKPVASCAMPVANNMNIYTNTPLVKKAQEGVLEFLLLNHPLDCPVCDQGGECDLQEQSFKFGFDKTRFFDLKRGVTDKNCGPLIKTVMTRCIHCTRCVRFATEIAGVESLGTTNRGTDTEITTYIKKIFDSEVSANVIDICPVGALTSKPYAFNARPWELDSITTIDLNDSVGVNIRVDLKESEIIRILPRECDLINEEWISNKTRFFYEGLKIGRLKNSLIRTNSTNYNFFNWKNTINLLSVFFSNTSKLRSKVTFIHDCFVNLETVSSVKSLAKICGVSNINSGSSVKVLNDDLKTFIFNIDHLLNSTCCFLLGINPRFEATSINLKLRKRFKKGIYFIGSLGVSQNLTFHSYFFGLGNQKLKNIFEGKSILSKKIKNLSRVSFLYGNSLTVRKDSLFFQNMLNDCLHYLKKNSVFFSFLAITPNLVGSLLINTTSFKHSYKEMINYVNGSELKKNLKHMVQKNGILNISNSSIKTLKTFDLNLCCKNNIEESGSFVNCFGLKQISLSTVSGPKKSRHIKKIIEFFLNSLTNFDEVSGLKKKIVFPLGNFSLERNSSLKFSRLLKTSYTASVNEFYLTNNVSGFSRSLLKCSLAYKKNFQNFL